MRNLTLNKTSSHMSCAFPFYSCWVQLVNTVAQWEHIGVAYDTIKKHLRTILDNPAKGKYDVTQNT